MSVQVTNTIEGRIHWSVSCDVRCCTSLLAALYSDDLQKRLPMRANQELYALELARQQGWSTNLKTGVDLCPACAQVVRDFLVST